MIENTDLEKSIGKWYVHQHRTICITVIGYEEIAITYNLEIISNSMHFTRAWSSVVPKQMQRKGHMPKQLRYYYNLITAITASTGIMIAIAT